MERRNQQPLVKWNQNRAGSILLLGISLILIIFSVFFVVRAISSSNENEQVSSTLDEKELEYEGVRVDIILAEDDEYQKITEYDKTNQNQNVITFK